jgi:hypothetical protein
MRRNPVVIGGEEKERKERRGEGRREERRNEKGRGEARKKG